MQRKPAAALCLLAVAILMACSGHGPPNSLFESAGYHIRDGAVYYLNAFPGKAFEIDGADAATFTALDNTYVSTALSIRAAGGRLGSCLAYSAMPCVAS